ncbi:MFS transporter [Pseudonocardia spinosispora]|uniref:MFS transporter n=1 Tax=Pseudonocardia spinosispora TaxID=103441 RepID=UPI000405972E|nr:MFS transporter [Pseudonocardia spinosispora]
MRRDRSGQQASKVTRAGWSSGSRRRRMWVNGEGVRAGGAPEPELRRPDPQPRAYEPWRDEPYDQAADHHEEPVAERRAGEPPPPRKLTVTRVAAWRGRQLTGQGIRAFQRAAGADGADRSGLTALTYASMMDYATDAAVAVALANTLFFSAATAESKTKVALYLLITVAPFALVAPVIGPLLDKVQRGRRVALAASFVGRGALAIVMAFHFNDWGLYPAALGALVLSKSFTVLRAAVTPRVLPEAITLVTTNSRLTVFGLLAGGVFGGIAAGIAKLTGSPGALVFTAVLCGLGAWLCLRIPAWVEVTAGEVPASLRGRPRNAKRQPMGRRVVVCLWANGAVRISTGFLTLFLAFVIKAQTEHNPSKQMMLLGIIGVAAGVGGIVGNGIGSKQRFDRSDPVVLGCTGVSVAGTVLVAVLPGVTTAAICAFAAATASALAKVCLDAVIQRDLPERSRASAFGRSETVLQLAWVFGGALGVLLPPVYWIGFGVVALVVALGGTQAMMIGRGQSLLPWIRHREQPVIPFRTVS